MRISLVVAVAENGVIGSDNDLPWRLKGDLKHFKATTMGKPIIMGRKTYESIGRPLPGRTNIVMSRSRSDLPEGVVQVSSLEEAFKAAEACDAQEACVTGGAEIYALALPYAHTLHFTRVHMDADGDTVFPEFDEAQWRETSAQRFDASEADSAAYTIKRLDRKGEPPQAYPSQ
ncbi:dihydrofolate reductase [Pyruvatibacter sp.]|uniref:dihydrofolate reductase n=1 Tax=Pyruvatibacter sp. TaxID=1981328 RepID=UPI0032642DDD